MTLRIVFIGCVELSYAVLDRITALPDVALAGVVTRARSPANADFRSLEPIARRVGCPLLLLERNDPSRMTDFTHSLSPQLLVCIGWSHLLGPELLAIAPHGVVGYHPTALPRNRGRHPLIWALALGLEQTGSTFFLMDERADSGPILSQRAISITPEDDAATLYAKMTETALSQVNELIPALVAGSATPRRQDEALANYWRRRTRADGKIDWRMSAAAIRNLVRALTHPYPGAHCATAGGEFPVWRAAIGPAPPSNVEPGRVLAVDGREILVKCQDGSVWLKEHELETLPKPDTYL
jgi:methionyl-tRNA formyltransferase